MDDMTKQSESTIETLAAVIEYNYSNPDSEISALELKDLKAALAGNRQLLIYLDAMRVGFCDLMFRSKLKL
jgi:hypothetical protein